MVKRILEKTIAYNKAAFVSFVHDKMRKKISEAHILSIQSILIEEMVKDLVKGKEIVIYNFAKIRLFQNVDRNFYNVWLGKMDFARGKKSMKIALVPSVRRFMKDHLDRDKID